MHDQNANGSDTISQLSQSMEKTLDQNRMLFTEMARFTRDESFRLAHMQLDRADQAFAHLNHRSDIPGLIGAQQEWIREMMQEYAAQSLRYAEMFRTLARHVQSPTETMAEHPEAQAESEQDEDHPISA